MSSLLWIAIIGLLILLIGGWIWIRPIYRREKAQRLNHLKSEVQVFESENGKIEYQEVGQGAPYLVFHGILGTYEHGRNAMWKLPLDKYQLIAVSRVGYSVSSSQEPISLVQQAHLIADLLTFLDISNVIVLAMSAGGPGGLTFAIQYPNLVEKLILLEAVTQTFEYKRQNILTTSGLLMQTVNSDPIAWLITRTLVASLPLRERLFANNKYSPLHNPERKETYKTVIKSFFPTEFMAKGYHHDVDQASQLANLNLGQIDCPTLILHGKADTVVPIDHSYHAHQQISDSRLVTIGEGADHDFHLTHPDMVWSAIFDFIEKSYTIHYDNMKTKGDGD